MERIWKLLRMPGICCSTFFQLLLYLAVKCCSNNGLGPAVGVSLQGHVPPDHGRTYCSQQVQLTHNSNQHSLEQQVTLMTWQLFSLMTEKKSWVIAAQKRTVISLRSAVLPVISHKCQRRANPTLIQQQFGTKLRFMLLIWVISKCYINVRRWICNIELEELFQRCKECL